MADRDILPGTVKPVHYDLLLTDLEFKDWTYKGTVKIDAKLTQASSEIVINTWDVKLHNVKVSVEQTKAGQTFESTDFAYDTKKQRTTIRFKEQLPASAKAQIVIDFEAIINHDMSGFYRSQYKPPKDTPAAASVPRDEDFHYMMSTQFEACDARRAFPCFDEPNLKATFDVALEIPDDQVALSNMPVKEEKPGNKSGTKLVTFERTPVMSTYLLAWAIGDFEYIEALTDRRYNGKQIPVRVYTTRGLIEQGRWALQHAPKYIDFFSEKFEIDYPLPKSDILAVHEFTHGAMENWGLVTYRTTAILFDEKQSDAVFRNRIAYVVAHELAHQWFGNLVTMDWWDELWLNEGFATWAGWVATEHLHPDWDVWAQWVNEGMETALGLDAVRASHPIHVPVRDALDVNQVFDAISYLKGCSVIRMLANHLGTETFLKGVAIYLKKNKYGNATTQDLWAGLSEASGQDINTIMGPWVEKIGHPVLTVAEEPGQITVKQSRFLSTGDVEAKDDTTTWWVPLSFEGKAGTQGIDTVALTTKEETIRDVNDDFYKLNSNATGFYRVSYPPARLVKLGTQLDRLSVADKIATAGSAAELAFSGYGTTPALLSFVQGFSGESHYRVLSQALDAVGTVKGIFGEDDDIRRVLERFILELIERPLSTIGWDFPAGEDFNKGLLRKRLLLAAGVNGHTGVQEEALRRFRALRQDPANNRPHPDLRRPIYRVALKADPADTVAFLQDEWRTSNAPDGREVSLATMGHVFDAGVVTRTLLPFLFGRGSDCVPAGDMHYLASGLAHNRVARPLLWQYMRENWGEVVAKVGGNPVVLDRLVKVSLQQFSDRGALASIEGFFAGKDTGAFNRTLETVKDRIRGRAAYRERDAAVLREWAAARGAA